MTDDVRQDIFTAQVEQLYSHVSIGYAATLVNVSILTFIQWDYVSRTALIAWASALVLLTLFRYFGLHRLRPAPMPPEEARRWAWWFIIGITVSGAIWGSSALFLFPADSLAHQIFLAFVLGGMVAGASAAFSALKGAFLAYSLPAMLPIAFRFLKIGDDIHITMGLMVIIFLILNLRTALRIHAMTATTLELRFRNKNLIKYLSEAKEHTEEINRQLEAEITERKCAEAQLKAHRNHLESMVARRTAELRKSNSELQTEIAERQQVERALRESEEKYRQLIENANDAILIVQDGTLKFANQKTLALSGYSMEELSSGSLFRLVAPDDRKMVMDRYIRRLRLEPVPSTYSFRFITKAGEQRWVDVNAAYIQWQERPAVLTVIRDTTEQKRLEVLLQQAQKMEAIGTLAGGIAHDFNNLLMGIQGNASLALFNMAPQQDGYEQLKRIEQYVESGSELTKQLLGFARKGKYQVKVTDLNKLIKESYEIFARTRKEITVHTRFQEDLWMVAVDRRQIEQVLLNIYVNAWQAMPDGGDLYLATENATLTADFTNPFRVSAGDYVKISVRDTGLGMDAAVRQRIFEPFFSTKDRGRGTGLGLASAYGIIKNHNGLILVDSSLGRGSTFHIYLPATRQREAAADSAPEKLLPGHERILLVDDEDMILQVGRKLLEKLGYEVITACNGREAIAMYETENPKIDLVILDMIMPEMGGKETYERLTAIDPKVCILISSGYSMNGLALDILGHPCSGFIQKPFKLVQLSRKIREILDEKTACDDFSKPLEQ